MSEDVPKPIPVRGTKRTLPAHPIHAMHHLATLVIAESRHNSIPNRANTKKSLFEKTIR